MQKISVLAHPHVLRLLAFEKVKKQSLQIHWQEIEPRLPTRWKGNKEIHTCKLASTHFGQCPVVQQLSNVWRPVHSSRPNYTRVRRALWEEGTIVSLFILARPLFQPSLSKLSERNHWWSRNTVDFCFQTPGYSFPAAYFLRPNDRMYLPPVSAYLNLSDSLQFVKEWFKIRPLHVSNLSLPW